MKPGKTRRKVIGGNADTMIRQPTVKNPPAYRQCGGGGRDEEGTMAKPTTVKTLPRIVGVAGGRDEERRIKGEHRREDKENQSQNPPAGYHRGGRARQEAKTNTKEKGGTIHSPAGGEVPS